MAMNSGRIHQGCIFFTSILNFSWGFVWWCLLLSYCYPPDIIIKYIKSYDGMTFFLFPTINQQLNLSAAAACCLLFSWDSWLVPIHPTSPPNSQGTDLLDLESEFETRCPFDDVDMTLTLVFQIPPEVNGVLGIIWGSSHASNKKVFGSLGWSNKIQIPWRLGGGFKCFYFHPYQGKWSNLTKIFHTGWNHQLDVDFGLSLLPVVTTWTIMLCQR